MKRLTFILIILQFAFVSKAQPSIDGNWLITPILSDDFNTLNSSWDSDWEEMPDSNWHAAIASGATHGNGERMVYRKANAIFDASGQNMKLKAEYAGGKIPNNSYEVPGFCSSWCYHPEDTTLYYYSGAVTSVDTVTYGYFEIQCKLPVNRGAFPAFWLWGNSANNYREIDVFEYSWEITRRGEYEGTPRYFEAGVYYGSPNNHYGVSGYTVPYNIPDLTEWHTYGMEWSPKRILWYFDNKLIGSFFSDYVPSRSMFLMANNSVNSWVDQTNMSENFPNEMLINYIKVYKLDCNCQYPAVIQYQTQFNSFDYKVYNSITIGGYGYSISALPNSKVAFRATNSITINGDFTLPLGSSLELITHACPE